MVALTPQEVQGKMTEHREIFRPMIFSNPAGVLIKGHIQDPMKRVFNPPVFPHGVGEHDPIGRKGR